MFLRGGGGRGGPFSVNLRGKGCRCVDTYICDACAVRGHLALLAAHRCTHIEKRTTLSNVRLMRGPLNIIM